MAEMGATRDTGRSDRELVESVVRHKDELAFRELYRRHTPRLFMLVVRLLARGDEEAEDVLQEVWIRAFEGLSRFQWKSAFATWLTGIALNRVRNRIRSYGRSRETSVDVLPEVPVARGAHEARIDLERAIGRLPDELRMVLVLHDVEGMKHREISGHLDIPVGTSKTHLSNARRRIRVMMSGQGEAI